MLLPFDNRGGSELDPSRERIVSRDQKNRQGHHDPASHERGEISLLNPASPFNPEHQNIHGDRVGDQFGKWVNAHFQIRQSPSIGRCALNDSGIAELDKGVPDLFDCL